MKGFQRKELTLNDVVLGNIRRRGRQNAILALSVVLAVYFLSAALFGVSSLIASVREAHMRKWGLADVVLWNAGDAVKEELRAENVFSEMEDMEILYASDEPGREMNDSFTIGRYTPEADSLLRYQLVEGRFPEEEGEIALESGALMRMRLDAEPGDQVTLKLYCYDGNKVMAEPVEKTFTLTGILRAKGDRSSIPMWFAMWQGEWENWIFRIAPQALVSAQEPVVPGARAVTMTAAAYADGNAPEKLGEYRTRKDVYISYSSGWWNRQPYWVLETAENIEVLSVLAMLLPLTIASMAGIANALGAGVDRRRQQIGLLRAIGATQRQIRKLLLRETIGIMVCTLPVGLALAFGTLKLLEHVTGGYLIWYVPMYLVLADVLLCAGCIWLASMRPVRRFSKITPMQAVRDIDFARMFLRKGEKSRKSFVPQKLIARRNTRLRPGRTIGLTILYTAGAVLFSVAFIVCASMARTIKKPAEDIQVKWADSFMHYYGYGDFLNENIYANHLTSSDMREIEELPYVTQVETVRSQRAVLLLDEITDYLTVGHFSEGYAYASPELYAYDRLHAMGRGGDVSRSDDDELLGYEDYLETKARFGIEREIIAVEIEAVGRETLEGLREYVTEGTLNVDKVLSGEEVLVIAPKSVACAYWKDEDGTWQMRDLYDGESVEGNRRVGERMYDLGYTPEYTNDVFRAGDTLEYEIWSSEGKFREVRGTRVWPDDVTREHRTVKIGAILSKDAPLDENLWMDHGIRLVTGEGLLADTSSLTMRVWLENGINEELQAQISEEIKRVAERSGSSFNNRIQDNRESWKIWRMFLLVFASGCTLLFAFSWAMLMNAVAGRIRSDVRQIGLMRAVGASRRIILRAYVNQFVPIFLCGGLIACAFSVWFSYFYGLSNTWSFYLKRLLPLTLVTPAYCLVLLGLCVLGVWARLKPIFRQSVVENIRML